MSNQLKQMFIDEVGEIQWNESWQAFSQLDPEFFMATARLIGVPRRKNHLSAKVRALVTLVVDSAATHLYVSGLATDIKEALAAGASKEEILEAIELASTLGIHACNIGVPTLIEVMKEESIYESHPTANKPLDEHRLQLKASFEDKRGYWHPFWEEILALDPEFFDAYTNFSSVPWVKSVGGSAQKGGVLPPKVKEFMYCAFDAAATHLYRPGLKEHMRNALRYGATVEELLEVLEIATLLSIHTANVAMPILAEQLKTQNITA